MTTEPVDLDDTNFSESTSPNIEEVTSTEANKGEKAKEGIEEQNKDTEEEEAQVQEKVKVNLEDNQENIEEVAQVKDKEEVNIEEGLPASSNEDSSQDKKEEGPKDRLKVAIDAPLKDRLMEVFQTMWPLGFITFGGTEMHLRIFKKRLVKQREWFDEEAFEEFKAMAEGLPGPTSTQFLLAATSTYAGPWGGMLAILLLNIPALFFMIFAGLMIREFVDPLVAPWYLAGLPAGALGLLFKSFYRFAEDMDKVEYTIVLIASVIAILTDNEENIDPASSRWLFPAVVAGAGLFCFIDSRRDQPWADYGAPSEGWNVQGTKNLKRLGITAYVGGIIMSLLGVLLAVIFVLRYGPSRDSDNLEVFETSARLGSLYVGGEEAILQSYQNEIVSSFRIKGVDGDKRLFVTGDELDQNWMLEDDFLHGMALQFMLPGSYAIIAAYLGAIHTGLGGALLGFVGIMIPGLALTFGVAPFWDTLRHHDGFRAIHKGVSAATTGVMGAACMTLTQVIVTDATNSIIFMATFALTFIWKFPAPAVVFAGGVIGALLHPNAIDLGQTPYCVDQGFIPIGDDIQSFDFGQLLSDARDGSYSPPTN